MGIFWKPPRSSIGNDPGVPHPGQSGGIHIHQQYPQTRNQLGLIIWFVKWLMLVLSIQQGAKCKVKCVDTKETTQKSFISIVNFALGIQSYCQSFPWFQSHPHIYTLVS